MIKIISIFLACIFMPQISAADYNILNYGAKSDTAFLSTDAIQNAINACHDGGGGRVIIPAGTYKTGTIILKSNVDLYLGQGALLYGSRNLKDYKHLKPVYISLRTQEATVQLIYAENAENISISGFGEINGQGSSFKKLSWNDEGITRPHLLRFITCKGINISGVTLKNSGCWMQHYLACEELRISGIKIFNRNNYNNDGIDIDGCRNVTISDVMTDSDDDGITLKSTSPRPCENIVITNCVISSRCNAIKMGTESNGGFRNIAISNCVIKPSPVQAQSFFGLSTGISGISLEIVDGGIMQSITISNITIDGTESPLFIRLGNRARSYRKDLAINHTGQLYDVTIDQVMIRRTGSTGCSITGLPGHPVSNIRLSNISYEQQGGCSMKSISASVPEKPKDYPEATMFGTLPAYGFYIRHASGITMKNVELSFVESDTRSALVIEDVQSSEFSGIKFKAGSGNTGGISIENSADILFSNNIVKGNVDYLVWLTGTNKNILLLNNIMNEGTLLHNAENNSGVIIENGNVFIKN